MGLEHILLGMLREPATGYDLGRQFAEGVRHFWFAERSQIYPTLKRMQERGWLHCEPAPSERGPSRKVYEITPHGREELRRWLRSGPHIGQERLAYIAETFFLGELADFRESVAAIGRMRSHWRRTLAELEFIDDQIRDHEGDWPELDVDGFHYYAALRMGLHQLRAKLAWCDETLQRLDARIEARTSQPHQPVGAEL